MLAATVTDPAAPKLGVGFYWIRFAMGTLGTDALCTFYENDRLLQQFHANASYHQDDCSELQLHAWKYSADTNPILVVAVPGSSGDTALSELLKGPQFQLIGALCALPLRDDVESCAEALFGRVDLGNHEPPPETQLDIAFTGPSTITSPPSSTSVRLAPPWLLISINDALQETPPDAKHGDQTSVTTGWSTLIGPIIGAVLGAVVLVVVASALIYSCRARRRRFARAEQTMSGETGELLGSRPSAGYTLDRSISGRLVMSAGDDATDADLETTQNRKEPVSSTGQDCSFVY